MHTGLAHALLAARREARAVVLYTPLDGGLQRLLDTTGLELLALTEPELAAAGRAVLASDRAQVLVYRSSEVLITAHNPPLRLIVVGAVHISEALCTMAREAGYDVTVIDPRSAFLRPERFPGVTLFDQWPDAAFAVLKPDARTAVVLLTHDPKIDDPALLAVLPTPAFYVGALGSTRTHAKRLARLTEAGVSDADRARIHGPAGLDIGARTPAEIAISVLAEITQRLRQEPRVKFGTIAVADALGAVLAHSVKLAGGALKKGTVLGAAEISRLDAAGITRVLAARLDANDVAENVAAARIAAALAGAEVEVGGATTGRVNLHAQQAGLLRLNAARIHAANCVHEGLTIATLLPDSPVEEGQMLATVKIIPYAVPATALDEVIGALGAQPALRVAPWRGIRAALLMTNLSSTSASILAKMRGAVLGRLGPLGGSLVAEQVVPHEEDAVATALRELLAGTERPQLLLVSGVAATVDRGDVVPAAVRAAGGRILHAGMPVDPGNLLLLGELADAAGSCPLIGIPTCARSPKLNGFDFVLRRYAAGETVSGEDIMAMGVGGLLTEIETRPMLRDTRSHQTSD